MIFSKRGLGNHVYWIVPALVVLVLMKVNRKVNFLVHFLVFGQILPPVALVLFPVVRLLGIYKGPPNQTVSQFWADISCKYFRCKFKNVRIVFIFRFIIC